MSDPKREKVMGMLMSKIIKQKDAALVLGLSVRQVKRLYHLYREQGTLALPVARRGQPAKNRITEVCKKKS